jgi:hypothetical protein
MTAAQPESPKPHEMLVDEGGNTNGWLKDAWTIEDIREEWEWLDITEDKLETVWLRPRWVTEEERADPDRLYDLFGEWESMDTTVYYENAKPDTPGAVAYWFRP